MSCKRVSLTVAVAVWGFLFTAALAAAADKETLTGTVSDSMCGMQHMQGTSTECTRACVGHGSNYTLVVGEKVYALNTDDKALRSALDHEAGKNVTITGTVNGVAIEVSSVVPAK